MDELKIGETVSLPVQSVTEKIGVFGISGSGKTNTAGVLVEEMFRAGQHVVVFDPLGVCWGLLSSQDGQSAGLPLVILGGKRAQLPLTASNGAIVADLIVQQRLSCILDLSRFDVAESTEFCAALIRRLLDSNAAPLHLVFDEAQMFAPQSPEKRQAPLVSAMERLTLTGRVSGLGMTFVSQRPSLVSKNVVSQMGVLICHRINHVADQKVLSDWAAAKMTPEQLAAMRQTLALQGKGEAWIVGESDEQAICQQAQIRRRETFDSSATPKVGQAVNAPQTLAETDLTQLRDVLTAAMNDAETDDPETLKQQVRMLRTQLSGQGGERPVREIVRVEVPIVREEDMARLEAVCQTVVAHGQELLALGETIRRLLKTAEPEPSAPVAAAPVNSVLAKTPARAAAPKPTHKVRRPMPNTQHLTPNVQLSTGAKHLLTVMARNHPRKLTKKQLGTLAQRSHTGGAFQESLGKLREAGFYQMDGDYLILTAAGRQAANIGDLKPQTTAEVLSLWQSALKAREMDILRLLVSVYPKGLHRERIALQFSLEPTGGAFGGYLSTLRTNGLITLTQGVAKASADLIL